MNKFVIYTDGASSIKCIVSGDTKHRLFYGGWAFVVIDSTTGKSVDYNSGGGRFKTGQAELCAIGAAFDWLEKNGHRGCSVKFKTDSKYAIKAMVELIHRNDSELNYLANAHILKRLRKVVKRHGGRDLARYHHVKGHDGHIHNEAADELAVAAKHAFMSEWHVQDLDAIESGALSISKSKSS